MNMQTEIEAQWKSYENSILREFDTLRKVIGRLEDLLKVWEEKYPNDVSEDYLEKKAGKS